MFLKPKNRKPYNCSIAPFRDFAGAKASGPRRRASLERSGSTRCVGRSNCSSNGSSDGVFVRNSPYTLIARFNSGCRSTEQKIVPVTVSAFHQIFEFSEVCDGVPQTELLDAPGRDEPEAERNIRTYNLGPTNCTYQFVGTRELDNRRFFRNS
jgi:hypothetical protein